MIPVSIVIIAKNESAVIARTISKARLITNDIVVIDNGSTDGTQLIARMAGCRVYQKSWDGYAANKNKGIALAEYDWILSLDADEVPDDALIRSLYQLELEDPNLVYDIKFRSYYGEKAVRFGKWGRDHHVRLFNRTRVRWSESLVHETLDVPNSVTRKKLKGHIHHYSVADVYEFDNKSITYAKLCAKKYYRYGKQASFAKLYLSPLFNFLKNYILFLGFLDGKAGWEIASLTVKHTHLKYSLLNKMNQESSTQKIYMEKPQFANY
jgi:glycosyltransferase involved in cell wall biosynthesis